MNGDGFGDLIVRAANPATVVGAPCDVLYLVSGKTGGLIASLSAAEVYGASAPHVCPDSVSSVGQDLQGALRGVGDVNKDGFADLLIASKAGTRGTPQQYALVAGGSSKAAGLFRVLKIDRVMGDINFGGDGDYNADGFLDYIVVDSDDYHGPGFYTNLQVYSGADRSNLGSISGSGTSYGALIARPDGSPANIFRAYVSTSGSYTYNLYRRVAGGSPVAVWPTDGTFVGNPQALGSTGDVDRDGEPDVFFAFWKADSRTNTTTRTVLILSGKNGDVLRTITTPVDGWGIAIAGGRDWSGDGIADIAVAWLDRISIYSAGTGALLKEIPQARDANHLYNQAIGLALGDVTGDGIADLSMIECPPAGSTCSVSTVRGGGM
jgi:hypothetical protein